MDKKIIVRIDYAENIPDVSSRYVATINDDDYKIVVSGKSITECFEQIAISMDCIDFNTRAVV